MESSELVDASVFSAEEIEPLVTRVLDRHLSSFQYTEAVVDDCVNRICEDVISALAALDKPFKYIVTCVIMQSTGAGVHTAAAEYVDGANDGLIAVRWPNEKEKDKASCACLTTVFGVAV